MNVSKAVKVLTKKIREDENFRLVYKANVAMVFVDEYFSTPGFENAPYDVIREIANKAADRFLNNWCR